MKDEAMRQAHALAAKLGVDVGTDISRLRELFAVEIAARALRLAIQTDDGKAIAYSALAAAVNAMDRSLIDRSSIGTLEVGTPEVVALRTCDPLELVGRVLRRTDELDEKPPQDPHLMVGRLRANGFCGRVGRYGWNCLFETGHDNGEHE